MQIRFLSVVLMITASCNGQNNARVPKGAASESTTVSAELIKKDSAHGDPYLVESGDTVTPYGPHSIVRNVLQDRKGRLWFATWEGIIRYDGTLFTNMTLKAGLEGRSVFSLLEDKKGNLWFGTIGAGVYGYDGTSFIHFTAEQGLIDNRVTCMAEDKAGNIWFGTEKGVSRYNGTSFTSFTTREGLCHNSVNSIIQDKAGNLWFGTAEGVCYYDGNAFTHFRNPQGLPFRNVRSILEDRKGNLWFGGADGLFRYDGTSLTTLLTDFIGFIFEDRTGNLWCSVGGADGMTLSRYDGISFTEIMRKNTTNDHQVFGIEQDATGTIWFGTMNGVYRYNGTSVTGFAK